MPTAAKPNAATMEAVLRFYAQAGIDCALSETPIDRFALGDPPAESLRQTERVPAQPTLRSPSADPQQRRQPEAQRGRAPSSREQALSDPTSAVAAAVAAAARAQTLDELRAELAAFEGCDLRLTASACVFGSGDPNAAIMFVGDAVSEAEDIAGEPLVGRAGELFDRMLAAIGLDRTQVYLANALPWCRPGNRPASAQEAAICRPFLHRQIMLADPHFLVLLGKFAAEQVLSGAKVPEGRGQWWSYPTSRREIRAMTTLHPAYLLQQPLQKRLAWRDLLTIKAALAGSP